MNTFLILSFKCLIIGLILAYRFPAQKVKLIRNRELYTILVEIFLATVQ